MQVTPARQARLAGSGNAAAAEPSPQQLHSIALPCQVIYYYILHAPMAALAPAKAGSASRVQESLLRGGLLRSLVLLFIQLGGQPGAEPLRCALLLACAAAQPLVDWAAAVPGFAASLAAPLLQPGGSAALHGALWSVFLGRGSEALVEVLGDAQPAEKVRSACRCG
jgi:hypothetical protein